MEVKLTKEEISFMECLYDPIVYTENIILLDKHTVKLSNNPSDWDENTECMKIRPYQYLFLSYEYLYANDNTLAPKENFQRKIGAGTSYLFCGRKIGKSVIGLDCDNLCDIALNDDFETCVSSFDGLHLRKRMSWVCVAEGSKILMSDFTTKNVENIEDGDEIWSLEEKPKYKYGPRYIVKAKVLKKIDKGIQKVTKIVADSNSLELTPDHKIFSYSENKTGGLWREAKQLIFRKNNYRVPILNLNIENKTDYFWGVLLGLIESDGSKTKNYYKNKLFCGYCIIQSEENEIEVIEYILNKLNIKFTKSKVKSGYTGKKNICRFYIKRESVLQIRKFYRKLKHSKNKDIELGFVYGFWIGDGSIGNDIVQKQGSKHLELLLSILKKLKIKYSIIGPYENDTIKMVKIHFESFSIPFLVIGNKFKSFYQSNRVIQGLKKIFVEKRKKQKYFAYRRVYDLVTTSKSFIANGFIVHNCEYIDNHPFFQIFHLKSRKKTVNRGNYWIATENGHQTYSINENIKGQNPGSGYHQVHYNRFLYEENSYETELGYSKRVDSGSELGFVERLSGIPAFHKASPAAKIFNDTNKLKYLVRLPAFVSPFWDKLENEKRKKAYGGEGSAGYKINILAQIMQDIQSGFDMDRVRKNYNNDKFIKSFEITKENYKNFKNEIIIEGLKNAEKGYIAADIGDGAAPSEIIIIFKVKDKYLYRYNITLFGLIDEEQYQVILWLYTKLKSDYIGIDTTDGTGRAVYRRLAKVIPKKYLIWVHFSEKIVIGFEKDDEGRAKHNSKGQVIEKYEYVIDWSFQILKELMYDQNFDIALDDKVDLQFDGMIQTVSGNRTIYDNMTENHLLQAFQVFAITKWQTEFQPKEETNRRCLSLGVSSVEEGKTK